jgi:PAS domain S-box-containing protein
MSESGRSPLRGCVVGTRKWLDEIGTRFVTMFNTLSTSRELEESKAKLEEAQRVAHVGHWEWNLDTDANIWSAETYRIYGLKPQKGPIDIATISEMIHPDDRESVFRIAEQAIVGGCRPDAEHRIVRPSGEVRTVHSQGDLKRDASGRPFLMFGTVQDITDRKRTQEALQQSQFYLSEGQRLAHMGSWAFNATGFDYWSAELFHVHGLDPRAPPPTFEEYLGLVHPEDRRFIELELQKMLTDHRGFDFTKRIVRPDGTIRYVRCVGVPVSDGVATQGFVGTGIDVTEQELLTRELRRQQAYLAEAQSLTHIGSWACNFVTGRVLHLSDEIFRIYGFDPSLREIPFKRFYDATHPQDEPSLREAFYGAIHARTDYDLQYRIYRPDGAIRFLRSLGHHNLSGEIGDYVGITMDITERKQAEQEREKLRQLETEVAHINRLNMMGELAGALAHEIKQPIAASITSASACLRWLAQDPPNLERARTAAIRIKQEGNRAADVIDSLRSFYKKGPTTERQMVDVKSVAQEMTILLREEADRHSVSIHLGLETELPNIRAGRVQLQQVFMNLMLNAIQAMEDTGGELAVSARLSADDELIISISDTGMGLPVEGTDRIFNTFYSTKPQGTGMGLAITRSIVESYGGRIWATANQGAGATFHFTLPC